MIAVVLDSVVSLRRTRSLTVPTTLGQLVAVALSIGKVISTVVSSIVSVSKDVGATIAVTTSQTVSVIASSSKRLAISVLSSIAARIAHGKIKPTLLRGIVQITFAFSGVFKTLVSLFGSKADSTINLKGIVKPDDELRGIVSEQIDLRGEED